MTSNIENLNDERMNEEKTITFTKYLDIEDFLPECRNQLIGDYICPMCNGVYNNPLVDQCGHIYCSTCIEQMDKCPITNNSFKNIKHNSIGLIANFLDKQFVYCKNKHKDCKWEGKLSDLNSHKLNECQKQLVCCQWIGCDVLVNREDQVEHQNSCEYRIVNCSECNIEIAKLNLIGHYDVCPNYKLDCPNHCDLKIMRKDLKEHLEVECDNMIVECPYVIGGCNEKLFKKDLANHLNTEFNLHNYLTLQKLLQTKREIKEEFDNNQKIFKTWNEKINEWKSSIELLNNCNTFTKSKKYKEFLEYSEKETIQKAKKEKETQTIQTINSIDLEEDSKCNCLQTNQLSQNTFEQGQQEEISNGNSNIINLEFLNKVISMANSSNASKFYFDTRYISKGISITDNKIKVLSNAKNDHKFVMSSISLNNKMKESF